MFCTPKRASILTYIRNTTYNLLVQQFTLESSCLQSWNHRKIAFEFLFTLIPFYKGFLKVSKALLDSAHLATNVNPEYQDFPPRYYSVLKKETNFFLDIGQ